MKAGSQSFCAHMGSASLGHTPNAPNQTLIDLKDAIHCEGQFALQPLQKPRKSKIDSWREYGSAVLKKSSSTVLNNLHIKANAYAVSMQFGDRLKELRKAKTLSQEELGRGLGERGEDVTKQTVSGWENNRHWPTTRQLSLICEKLNESADYLLFGISPKTVARAMILLEKTRSDYLQQKDLGIFPDSEKEAYTAKVVANGRASVVLNTPSSYPSKHQKRA